MLDFKNHQLISNIQAQKIVGIMESHDCVVVGSYGRNEKLQTYRDIDFLSFKPLIDLQVELSKYFKDKISFIRMGPKYMKYTINNKYHVDVWKTSTQTFKQDLYRRITPKHKIIFGADKDKAINKFMCI